MNQSPTLTTVERQQEQRYSQAFTSQYVSVSGASSSPILQHLQTVQGIPMTAIASVAAPSSASMLQRVQTVQSIPMTAVSSVAVPMQRQLVGIQEVRQVQPTFVQPIQVTETTPVQIVQAPARQVVVAAPPPPPRPPPPPPPPEYEYITKHVEVDQLEVVPVDREIVSYDVVPTDKVVENERAREVSQVFNTQVPQFVTKTMTIEVPQPREVRYDKIVKNEVLKEVPREKVVNKEVAVPVDKVVVKEVPVYVDKYVEKIVHRAVPVEKIIMKEVPVEVEKVQFREVQVPVERIVDKFVDVPVERVVHHDKIVYQDKVVYNDKPVEVPVERMIAHDSLETYSSNLRRSLLDVNSRKVGLGLVLRVNNDGEIVIKELIHGYAAQRQGGLREGDVLVTIDGQRVQDYNLEEIKKLTFGEEGSLVNMEIRRDGTDQKVTLQRISGTGQSNALMSSVRSSYAES